MKLTTEEIRSEISKWMARLFDKDKLPADVRLHVEDITKKILISHLGGHELTLERLQQLFQNVETNLAKDRQ